ncbi:K(+)-transporting ATPase subunit C [Mycobacterium sp.]|uniref:K(+)-transporting ATPase subunit C n=1 Tax=Mycobacterium sp. TaxID=1785 RepID=UPI002C2AB0AE|nr:K(+)-transporting ATPase subunit C [Mycobacterium sp.]HTY29955.1 K(+)-transporting ATPase subunit C [Mycobacterium sp.]
MLRHQLVPAVVLTILASVVLGVAYPLATYGIGQLAFRHHAEGSLISRGNQIIGSSLLGQSFTDAGGSPLPQYFQPRPSAAGSGYDATASGASNLGPSDPRLLNAIRDRAAAYRAFNHLPADAAVPIDAVTASGSGLDPDISVANAALQSPRVAATRHLPPATVAALIRDHTTGRALGFLGETVVNVVELNLALDQQQPPGR